MKIWLDAQFSPLLVPWIERSFTLEAQAIQADPELISSWPTAVDRVGTAGNTSTRMMKQVLAKALPKALEQIEQGEALVEISQAPSA